MSDQRQRTSTSAQFGVFDTSGTYMKRDIYILQCLPLEALKCLPCLPVERKVIRTSGSSIILGKQDYVEVRSAQKNGCLGLCLKGCDIHAFFRSLHSRWFETIGFAFLVQLGAVEGACLLVRVFETGDTKQVR